MTSRMKQPKFDYYLQEKDELADFTVDQTVIIKEPYLSHVVGSRSKNDDRFESVNLDDWYSFVNSYYPYTEDVDAVERSNHLLATKPSIASLSSPSTGSNVEEYTEKSARHQYLESNPVSFIILGKPDIGEQELGKKLADFWQCVYIEPETLIEQEIQSGSRAGQCIEFNLRCGRAIGVDVILRLVEKRVNSESAKHRGFVICGFPLISNDLYQEDPISSESAVFNVKEIFDDVLGTAVELGVPPSRPQVSVSSKFKSEVEDENLEEEEVEEEEDLLQTAGENVPTSRAQFKTFKTAADLPLDIGGDYDICQPPEIGTNYEDQVNFLFSLLKKPFLIIYILCGTKDVIDKRDNYKYDVYSKLKVDLLREKANKHIYNYFTTKQGMSNEEIPDEYFEASFTDIDSSNLKHLVSLPLNFRANVSTQLDAYHYTVFNFIERQILLHDPQYFIKVDGRTNVNRMLYIIKSKLKILPLQKVILPARLSVPEDTIDGGEGASYAFSTKDRSFEDCYREFRKRDIPSSVFKWKWSDWGTKCPVSMRHGICRNGNPDFAVRFLNKIFFLADEQAFLEFYRNPRPHLLPPYPKPACKIFIFGPKCSGKTAVAKCLAYLLNGTVLSTVKILENFLVQQEGEHKEKIRQAAIAEAMLLLNQQRKEEAEAQERDRVEQIKEWAIAVKHLIAEIITLLGEMDKEQTVTKFEISSFPMAMKKISLAEIETETTIALRKLLDQLETYKIPYSSDSKVLEGLVRDRKKLFAYLPVHLRHKVQPKRATVFDDFVVDFANNAVLNADLEHIDLNNKIIIDMFINAMKSAEETYMEQGNIRGGWIMDGMICDISIISELYPEYIADDIIVLKDAEGFEFLKNRFVNRGENLFWNYKEFFMGIGKMDAALRAPSELSTQSYKGRMVHDLLSEIFDDEVTFGGKNIDGENISKRMENYQKDLNNFNGKWAEANEYFLKMGIQPIEIQVTDKSLEELMKEVIMKVEDRYRATASPFSDEDRAEEVKDFGDETVQEEEEEEQGESQMPHIAGDDFIDRNRRYGDTYHYCPVTFHESWVLWKGKEEFAVKFQDQVYLPANEIDMKKFLLLPRKYLSDKPPREFPPPRICIVGIPASGKTYTSKVVANNYGVAYFNFESLLKKEFHVTSSDTLEQLMDNAQVDQDLRNYLSDDAPLPEKIYAGTLHKLWYKYPVRQLGFVIDGFPKRPSDFQFMIKHKLIPDIVIRLIANDVEIESNLVQIYLDNWQSEIDKKRALFEEENQSAIAEREEKRKKRFQELIDERRERRYSQKRKEMAEQGASPNDEANKTELLKSISQVSFDSVADQRDVDEINRVLDVEMPELPTEMPAETIEEAKERFDLLISRMLSVENEFLQKIQAVCELESIPFLKVIADVDSMDRTYRSVLFFTDKIKHRTASLFERCYDISMEVADRLLSCGYYFLSKFGKTCPVQYYENTNPFHMYMHMEQTYNIYPVIHRNYIYFIIGKINVDKFKSDPLRYINVENVYFPLIPFKVAISGPPKCGKTTLARRIKSEFGIKVISKGQAARYVLSSLPFSSLAQNMEQVLRKGWELTDEMTAKCVEAAYIDAKAVTQGVVFDGFPNGISEVKHLSYLSLVPNLVIELEATQDEIFECLSNDTGKRGFPKYSQKFVEHFLNEWQQSATDFRDWFDREYQILTKISIESSNWSVWSQARALIYAVLFEIKHYYSHVHQGWPLRLANMQVTPLEFLQRQSSYKTFCPCCLHYSNVLTSGGEPPDRTGLVQFKSHFYWLCYEHIEAFLKTPEAFLTPYSNHTLPTQLPTELRVKTMPGNVFENGACVVCYKSKRAVVQGTVAFAVGYNMKTYLFDSKSCMEQFMKQPRLFLFDINFKPPDDYPSLNYGELPVIGMLEQYVAGPVIKALNFISRRRPVIPGLSVPASAAIGVGLHLKVYDQRGPEEYKPRYREADRLFHERRQKLIRFLDRMKSVINPYLHYEEPMAAFHVPASVKSETTESVTTAMSKLVDEIVDNIDCDV